MATTTKKDGRANRGGARENAGRPNKYTCDVQKLHISVPVDAVLAIKTFIRSESDKYLIKSSKKHL